MAFELWSSQFKEGGQLPPRHACDGENLSPAIQWENPPERSASYVLLSYNPNHVTGVWSHWVLYNIPADFRRLDEGVPPESSLPWGGCQVSNDHGGVGYAGPCLTNGSREERIVFRLFALARSLTLPDHVTHRDLIRYMRGHLLGDAKLTAVYLRA